jgi:hypothetical protein
VPTFLHMAKYFSMIVAIDDTQPFMPSPADCAKMNDLNLPCYNLTRSWSFFLIGFTTVVTLFFMLMTSYGHQSKYYKLNEKGGD